ncbi:protein kinase domain-containing protein [Candidatus Uabimicrobium amorphum]|uniref:Protein kinase n=1 Tax=Uabimicrobium amorphum TaxID=2596890 RepID=A0A5S9IT68_UABAM|nr:protein kinase [Candidatus Uabimicrobium amorphum]BBM86185.1 protein kinase [Candidatus Uabimicrobium amorphum]
MKNSEFKSLWTKVVGAELLKSNEVSATYKSNNMSFSNDITMLPDDIAAETFSSSETVAPHNSSHTFSEENTIAQQQNATFSKEETIAPVSQSQQINLNCKSDYQNFREINRGGMGIIYEAQQSKLKRKIAIKKMLANAPKEKFLAESLVTAYLEHPNIVPVHDMEQNENDEILLAMKLVKGLSWKQILYPKTQEENEKATQYDQQAHLQILMTVCNAIDYAHSKGIVHCDLKPENIMIGDFGEVLVMDWGIAVDINENTKEQRTLCKSDITTPMGTPCYMPPELAEGRGEDISPATDIYLLGGILYEILHKEPPRKGKDLWQILFMAKEGQMPHFDETLPNELIHICRQALAKNISNRYVNVGEFKTAIEDYLSHHKSIVIAQEAEKILEECTSAEASEMKHEEVYRMFTKSIATFEQAIELWQDNEAAKQNLLQARNLYIKTAIANDDIGIAETQKKFLQAKEKKLHNQIGRMQTSKFINSKLMKILSIGLSCVATLIFCYIAESIFSSQTSDNLLVSPLIIFFVVKATEEIIKAQTQSSSSVHQNTIVSSILCYICINIVTFPLIAIAIYAFLMLCYSYLWVKIDFRQRLSLVVQQISLFILYTFIQLIFEQLHPNLGLESLLQVIAALSVAVILFVSSRYAQKTIDIFNYYKQPWLKTLLFLINLMVTAVLYYAIDEFHHEYLYSQSSSGYTDLINFVAFLIASLACVAIFFVVYLRIYNVWPEKYDTKEKFFAMLYHVFIFFSITVFLLNERLLKILGLTTLG